MIIITPIMLKRVFASRIFLVIETNYLLAFPLILLRFKPDLIHIRMFVLITSLTYIFFVIRSQKITLKRLGLKPESWSHSIKTILKSTIFSMLLILIIFLWYRERLTIPLLVEEIRTPSILVSVLTYIFISAPLQEFVYRGYLISRLELVSVNKLFLKLYTSIFFMLIHTAFNNWFLTAGSFILGWWWAGHFLKDRNIFNLMLSHILIGSTYIILMGLS